MNTETTARNLIASTLATHTRNLSMTIECDCGGHEVYLAHDYNADDVDCVMALIEHATFEHATPRAILAVVHTRILDTASIRNNN